MSFTCHKCDKVLSSKRSLAYHLKKTLPCDLTCRVCNFKCDYRNQYYRHMKTHEEPEPEKVESDDEEILELPRAEHPEGLIPFKQYLEDQSRDKPELIPIDDFMNHSDYTRLLQEVSDAEDCEITMREIIREVVVKPSARTNLDRVRRAIYGLDPSVYMRSLQCLSSSQQLDDVACDVLTHVHGDEKNPEHHTICLSDSSRKTAKIYTRAGDRPTWTLHPREASLSILRRHTSNVMSLLLEHAVEKLQDTSFIRNYRTKHSLGKVSQHDRIPCVCMSDSSDYIMICFDTDANIGGSLDETPLLVEYVSYDDLFAPGNIDPMCYTKLRESIQSRKEQILEQLQSLIIDEKKLVKFLNHTRPVCINAIVY